MNSIPILKKKQPLNRSWSKMKIIKNSEWIWIKEETDKLSAEQIRLILVEWVVGDKNQDSQNFDLNNSFQELRIDSVQQDTQDHNKSKIFWNPEHSLMSRMKNEHLTYEQKLYIYKLHRYERKEVRDICQIFGVSISTVKRIIRQFSSNTWRKDIFKGIRWRKMISSPLISDWISEFVKAKTGNFISQDVRVCIQEKLAVLIPLHQIRKHLKKKEHLSYKKGSSRPISLNVERLKLMKQLFWVKLAYQLNKIKILLNIDESVFNRDTRRNYSWLKTGKACSITNTIFKGSINIISCIASNGEVINLFKYIPSNSEIFFLIPKIRLRSFQRAGIGTQRDRSYTRQLSNSQSSQN